jgi:hypothetical protein
MILGLLILAASPEIHVCIHNDASHEDHDCAVVLFAQGVTADLELPAITPPDENWSECLRVALSKISLKPPRYLHQPERGPPVLPG